MTCWARIAISAVVGVGVTLLSGSTERPLDRPVQPTDLQAYTARALREHFPNVLLTTQDKKTIRFYDDVIKDRIVMIQFMFTQCDRYCPMVTPNLVKVQKELQRQAPNKVTMISITVDPTHDTPEVLKQYSDKFHVQSGWQFLTGQKNDIDRIRSGLGVYDPEEKKTEHLNVLTIGKEPTGQWLAMEALATPDDIVQTVLTLAQNIPSRPPAAARSHVTNRR